MARIFNELLFEGWITTVTEIYSDAALNELLGRADDIRFQTVVQDFSGATPVNLTVTYYHSMNNSNWEQNTQFVTGTTTTPMVDGFNSSTSIPNGGFGRVGLAVQAGKKAYVKLYATGRTD